MSYVNAKDASKFFNVSTEALRQWAIAGKIESKLTAGGHRRYKIPTLNEKGKCYVYARVSSKKQEGDLQRQVKYITKRYPNYQIIKDIGS